MFECGMLNVEWSPLAMLNYSMLNYFIPHSSSACRPFNTQHSTFNIPLGLRIYRSRYCLSALQLRVA